MSSDTGHQSSAALADANRGYFRKLADLYDQFQGALEYQSIVERELVARQKWIGLDLSRKDLKVLDYACGTGLISQVLAPYSRQILGVDISESMVRVYNEKATKLGLADAMHGIVGDLFTETPSPAALNDKSKEEFWNFDLVVVGIAFHHFGDIKQALSRLTERLKGGGILMIVDFGPHEPLSGPGSHTKEGHHSHDSPAPTHAHQHHGHGTHGAHSHHQVPSNTEGDGNGRSEEKKHIGHHTGFNKEQMVSLFTQAGMTDAAVEDIALGFAFGGPPKELIPTDDPEFFKRMSERKTMIRDIFIAKAVKSVL